ncbi:hypothetical protein FACS1894161_5040 [Spirochaetia bacterium]|nr:hypothetical protein FACS1894161_5040 [Spirochaetia bacterium]
MRKIVLIIIACIAVVTFISAFHSSMNPLAVSRGDTEIIETH